MSANAILNADMATVGRWLHDAWRWWTGELANMVPLSLRAVGRSNSPLALYREDGGIKFIRGAAGTSDRARPADLVISASHCLERTLTLPAMRLADVRGTVALEANRLFPLGSDSLLIDAEIAACSGDGKTIEVRVAAIRRELAEEAASAAREAGIAPRRIGIAQKQDPDHPHFDFAPPMRASGLLPPRQQAQSVWWALVCAFFLLDIGLLVWRDQQSVEQLQAAVESQQPAVGVYRTIAARTARIDDIARMTAARRTSHDALGDLAAVTLVLPDSAWVQRYDWNGASLRLAGYYHPPTDVNAALSRSAHFVNVRTSGADVQADIPIGRPFDVTADLKRASR